MGSLISMDGAERSEKSKLSVVDGQLTGTAEEIAADAIARKRVCSAVIEVLACDNRSQRSLAAQVAQLVSVTKPDALIEYVADLTDALSRPEAQTRWRVLSALEALVDVDARVIDKAISPTVASLHDAESGVVRLAAFRLLCRYGTTTARRSEVVWPYIDEALRVYHGDAEFPSMLAAVHRFVSGSASESVKTAVESRVRFDAENAKGLIGHRARVIIQAAQKKRGQSKKQD